MDDEVEYQSQEQLITLASRTNDVLLSPPTFSAALQIHGQRIVTLNQIPSGNQPTVEQVRQWARNVQELYERMQTQLTQLVKELRD